MSTISLHCQIKFSSRNILIKIGHFQETPTACPSVKENHNKIGNLPYGYDLKKKKKNCRHLSTSDKFNVEVTFFLMDYDQESH